MAAEISRDELVEMMRAATESVFSMMLGIPVEAAAAYEEGPVSEELDGVISLVTLGGPMVGAGRISCSAKLACEIASALMMSSYDGVNDEVLDAMGELGNMIVGNVKTTVEDKVGAMVLGIPTVVYGRNYRARSGGSHAWTVLPFTCNEQKLEIRSFLVPARESSSVADMLAHANK